MLDFIPKKLQGVDERDLYIKSGNEVDEDNFIFDIVKDSIVLDTVERDDSDIIRNARQEDSKDKIELENSLQLQKRKWMATIPTILEYYNSTITNPNNKFLL